MLAEGDAVSDQSTASEPGIQNVPVRQNLLIAFFQKSDAGI
jgi:hypothetical protein